MTDNLIKKINNNEVEVANGILTRPRSGEVNIPTTSHRHWGE